MKLELKGYKLKKTALYFQKKPVFFLFNVTNLNSKQWLKTEQTFFHSNLKYYKVYNTLSKIFLNQSIFLQFTPIMNGNLCFLSFKDDKKNTINVQELTKIDPSMAFLGIKLNKKIYSSVQLKTLPTLNYENNIQILNKSLKKLLKLPYYNLNK
jgi:ribosomal protein L10